MEATPKTVQGTVVHSSFRGLPISFFVNNPGDHIQSFHLRGKSYEEEELAMIEKYCPAGSHILDGGSNVGNHAIYFEKFLSPKSVKVIEVNDSAIQILRINLLLNGCRLTDTSYLGIGLAEQDAVLEIVSSPKGNLGGTRFSVSAIGGGANGGFRAVAGDSLLAGAPVNFIKLDIEGMELPALRGLARTISVWQPGIFVEVGDGHAHLLNDWLSAKHYRIVDRFQRYGGLWNLILMPEERVIQ